MPDRVWYFVHVPKTAGTSVRLYLSDSFAEGEVLLVYPGETAKADRHAVSLDQVSKLPPRQLARYRVFFGHYPFRPEWMHYGRRGRGLAFVRDPAARVISWYHYVRGESAARGTSRTRAFHEAIRERRLGLAELYEHMGGIRELDNGIVRYLAGGYGWPVGTIGEKQLQRAIDNVETHFDFVGHTGHFEQSMERLSRILGRPFSPRRPANASPEGRAEDHIDAFPASFLERVTAVDRAFVDWVERRFF